MATVVILIALVGIIAMVWVSSGVRRHRSIAHQHERYQRERQRLDQASAWPEPGDSSWLAPSASSAIDRERDD